MSDESLIEEFVDKLLSICEKEDTSELKKILQQSESPISRWTPTLIQRLFQTDTSEKALRVVTRLVAIDDSKFSIHISEAVKAIATTSPQILSSISNNVIQVWMFQLCCTSQISVHLNLMKAFESLIEVHQDNLQLAMTHLTSIWKEKRDNSIISIRCATAFLQAIKITGDAALEMGKQTRATALLSQMVGSEQDPLLQLSVLDLFTQVFDHQNIPEATREWMGQEALITLVVNLLDDPIVSGAGMQYLGLVAKFRDPNILKILFQHIRDIGPTTNEFERLQIVHTLSNLAQSSPESLELILRDRELRKSWWDLSRTSIPKLQAAILSSIARNLGAPHNTNAPLLLRMYSLIGQDHATDDSTTSWMLQKFVCSPMPELRIASFTVWISLAQIPGGCSLLATSSRFMDLMVSGEREASNDARIAKFELLKSFHQRSKGFLATGIVKKLDEQLKLGPHGMKSQRWDVATE